MPDKNKKLTLAEQLHAAVRSGSDMPTGADLATPSFSDTDKSRLIGFGSRFIVNPTEEHLQALAGEREWQRGRVDGKYELEKKRLENAAKKEQAELGSFANQYFSTAMLPDSPISGYLYYLNQLVRSPNQIAYERHTAAEAEEKKAEQLKEQADWANKNKIGASAVSVGTNLISGLDYVNKAMETAVIGAPRPNSSASFTESTQALREGVSRDWSDTGKFLYNTGMSGLDSLAASMTGPGGAVLLGLSAASNTYNDIKARGGTDQQALIGGSVAGVFEGLFEKVSIGNLKALKELPVVDAKTILTNLAKSVAVNATEETLTEIANIAYDTLAMADLSNYAYLVRQHEQNFLAQGMSPEEAKEKAESAAKSDLFWQVVESTASGGLMGMAFGGLGTAGSEVNSYITGRAYQKNSQQADLVQTGLSFDEGTGTRKLAETINSQLNGSEGTTVGAKQIGRLANQMKYDLKKAKNSAAEFIAAGDDVLTATAKGQVMDRVLAGDQTLTDQELRRLQMNTATTRQVFAELTGTAVPTITDTKTLLGIARAAAESMAQESAANAVEKTAGADYTVNENKEDVSDGSTVHLRGSGERSDGTDPERSVSAVEGNAGQDQSGAVQRGSADGEISALSYGEKVSAAQLGIEGGSTAKSIRVVTGGENAAVSRAKQIAQERGLQLTLFTGSNLNIRGKDGAPISARAYIEGDRVFVRADHPEFTAEQLMRHEAGHDMIEKGEIDPDSVRDRIVELHGSEKLDELSQMYADAYAGSDMTADEIWEEIICDSLGDMNIFSGKANEATATEVLSDVEMVSTELDAESSRGPPAEGKTSREKPYVGLSRQEWRQVQSARMAKYGDSFDSAPRFDHIYAHNMLYVIENFDENQFGAIEVIDPGKDQVKATIVVEVMKDGSIEYASDYRRRVENLWRWQRRNDRNSMHVEDTGAGESNAESHAQDEGSGERSATSGKSGGDYAVDPITYSPDYAHWRNALKDGSKGDADNPDVQFSREPDPAALPADSDQQAVLASTQEAVRAAVREELERMGKEYGWIKPGENPYRDVQIPQRTSADKKVSQTVRTVMEAEVTPDDFVLLLEQETVKGGFSFIPITNDESVEAAQKYIMDRGWNKALTDWTADVRIGKAGDQITAIGALLYNNAVNSGNHEEAMDVLMDYQMAVRNSARGLQAARILKTLTPESRLYMIRRNIQSMVDAMKLPEDIGLPNELADAYMKAETDEDIDEAVSEIQQYVADQIPSTGIDLWTALRYTNMLGNFKTQVRNVSGNIGMKIVGEIENVIATGLEQLIGKEKTRSVVIDKELKRLAEADFKNVREEALGDSKYTLGNESASAFASGVDSKKTVFKRDINLFGKDVKLPKAVQPILSGMEGYRKATNWAMNNKYFGDEAFTASAYARALGGYLKANGITAEQFGDVEWQKKNADFLDKAREHAIKRAQELTFRDQNMFSDWISKVGRKQSTPKAIRAIAEGVLPFRRTPANVLIRAEEYSPLGLINTVVQAIRAKNGTATGTDVINSLAKTLTGAGIFVLGMALQNAGLLRGIGDGDDDESEFEELQGHQTYSLELPDGTSITLDWLTPAAMPLFMGAQFEVLRQDKGFEPKDLEQALTSIADPMLQMSMLQGLNDTLSDLRYSQDANIMQLVLTAALGYLTQGLTNSLLGQVTRTFSDVSTTTYVDKNSVVPNWLQRELGAASRKTPGWDYNQIPYIDAWGRTESSGSLPERIFNNMFNPAYTSEIETSPMEEELLRLYEATGEAGVFPSRADEYFTVNKERKDLTAEEYVEYATTRGQTAMEILTGLTENREYKKLADGDKAAVVELVYDFANEKAKMEVSDYEPTGKYAWIAKALKCCEENNIPPELYIICYYAQNEIEVPEDLRNEKGAALPNSEGLLKMQIINGIGGLTFAQRQAMFVQFGVGGSVILYTPDKVDSELEKMRE